MLERAIGAAMAVLQKALGITLIAAILLNFANVIGRYGFGYSILWADEVEMFILVLVTFLGAAIVGWKRQHLAMDVLRTKLPGPLASLVTVLEAAALVAIAVLVCIHSISYAQQMLMLGRTSDNAGIPMWIPHSSVAIGFALLAFVAIWQAVAGLVGRRGNTGRVESASDAAASAGKRD